MVIVWYMFGPWEIVLLIVLVLLLFGAKKVPELGRGIGSGMREFKDGIKNARGDKPEPRELESGDVPSQAPVDSRQTDHAER
jgi:sec-independent protein translocase protein TatA